LFSEKSFFVFVLVKKNIRIVPINNVALFSTVLLYFTGACEGTLTCSTCHVILKQEDFDRLPDKPTDEEYDMLDLAYDLTETLVLIRLICNLYLFIFKYNVAIFDFRSRLGCQIQLSKDLDGLEIQLPATINDARS
jgi:ferredoxin